MFKRLWRWWNECDGHCNLSRFDPSDALSEGLTWEEAARCYHPNRRPEKAGY